MTQQELKELLHYNPRTGLMTRLVTTSSRAKAGAVIGTADGRGYLQVRVNGKNYRIHRLAWLYMRGSWPDQDIDHINRIRSDNRWKNLREATRAENNHNSGMSSHNTSGFKGVSWSTNTKKWEARIALNNRTRVLGYFKTPELASQAYENAKRLLHPTAPTRTL